MPTTSDTSTEPVSAKYPPPPPETPKERTGRMVALFVMPFLIITMMFATYMSTMHGPHPRDLPVAVVGQGIEAERFATELEAGSDGALEVRVVPDVAAAESLVKSRDITGAIELPGDDGVATIHQAMAAGASQAGVTVQALTPPALAQGWQVETADLAPLPAGDGSGTMVLFGAMALMLAGYVPLSGLLMGTPNLLRVRKFLPLALGWGLLTSTVTWLILGPGVGAVDGHFPLFLGVGTLAVMAVGVMQLLLTKVMGPFAVLLGMLLWVIFGMPSSGLAMSVHTMPEFFQFLHGILPLPAAGGALQSAVYFDGDGMWGHVLTLAAWLVGGLVLALLKERKAGDLIVGGPLYTAPDAPLPALSGGPIGTYRKRLAAVALFPLAIMVTVVTVMGFSMHQPEIRNLPVAVVAPAAQAEGFVAAVEDKLGSYVELSVVESTEGARDLIFDEDVVAAYVLPTGPDQSPTLLTASGAGLSQKNAAVQIFSPIAAESGSTLAVEDLAPLTKDDVNGSNSLYVGMAWIMSAFLFFAVMRGGAPDLTRTRQLLPRVAGWSVGISVWLWFLFDVLIGAVNGHPLPMIGLGAFTIFAIAWPSAILTRMFGLGALVPVMLVVMLAGVPASGGGLSLYMVPELFRPLAEVLPLPAAVDIARSLVYLDGTGIGANLLVIAIWGAVGLALNFLVVDRWVNRPGAKPHAPMGPRYQPERKPRKSRRKDAANGNEDQRPLEPEAALA